MEPICDGGALANSLILAKAAVAPAAPSTVVELVVYCKELFFYFIVACSLHVVVVA